MRQFIYSMMIKEKIEVQFKFHDIEHITNNGHIIKKICYDDKNNVNIYWLCVILTPVQAAIPSSRSGMP